MSGIRRALITVAVTASIFVAADAFAQACNPGSFSATGNEPCTLCSAGTYQPDPGQTSCLNCSAGTFSGSGAASCSCCPAGYANPFFGASSCSPCGAGTYQLNTCSTACDPCPGGQANPCNGNGICSDGPSGNGTCSCFAGYSGVACENATPCSPGQYSATGNFPCSPCAAGTYQPSAGQTSCLNCPSGEFSTGGAASCTCCAAGYSNPIIGASSCSPCGAGTYQLNTCSTMCDPCPGGQATPCNGNGTCSDGPSGNGTCACFAGYYGFACEFAVTTSTSGTTMPNTTTTTLPTTCPPQPALGCLVGQVTSFQIRTNADPAKNQLKWKWSKGQEFQQPALGSPDTTTDYFLCIYDTTANVAALVATIEVGAGAGWTDKDPKGWSYKDKAGTQDGVTKIKLKTGAADKSKAQLSAKGAAIPLPAPIGGGDFFDQDAAVVVQLISGTGTCWYSDFNAGDTTKNEEDAFKATNK